MRIFPADVSVEVGERMHVLDVDERTATAVGRRISVGTGKKLVTSLAWSVELPFDPKKLVSLQVLPRRPSGRFVKPSFPPLHTYVWLLV